MGESIVQAMKILISKCRGLVRAGPERDPVQGFHCRNLLCMLGNFSRFFCCHLLIFSKHSFRNTFRVSNSLDSDHSVGHDLGPGPNCLQRISAVS